MDIATTLLEYGAQADAESKAGFTPLHLSAQEGHSDMSSLLIEHHANANHSAKVGVSCLFIISFIPILQNLNQCDYKAHKLEVLYVIRARLKRNFIVRL